MSAVYGIDQGHDHSRHDPLEKPDCDQPFNGEKQCCKYLSVAFSHPLSEKGDGKASVFAQGMFFPCQSRTGIRVLRT